jgi:hypothetical protein
LDGLHVDEAHVIDQHLSPARYEEFFSEDFPFLADGARLRRPAASLDVSFALFHTSSTVKRACPSPSLLAGGSLGNLSSVTSVGILR